MIHCFIKVVQRIPVVEKPGDLCNCDVTEAYEREGAGLAPETTPLVTTCIKQKQIQKILQEGARGNITAGEHVLNAIFASFYVCLG